jgi:hypothetical protein
VLAMFVREDLGTYRSDFMHVDDDDGARAGFAVRRGDKIVVLWRAEFVYSTCDTPVRTEYDSSKTTCYLFPTNAESSAVPQTH